MSHLTHTQWRAETGKTLAEAAGLLGIVGRNPARTLQRYERGERPCPLGIALAAEKISGGRVTPASFVGAPQAQAGAGYPEPLRIAP
ncbi:hypothetical protein ATO4_19949 [Aurantimonas sp. 22II-16-19i]|nr:hypothetical protein ATO4_19949 [Aurantimonas sp. 22II-16-19i]